MWNEYILPFILKWPAYNKLEMSMVVFATTLSLAILLITNVYLGLSRPGEKETSPPSVDNADLVLDPNSKIMKLQLFFWHTYPRDICQYIKRCGALLIMAFLLMVIFTTILFIELPSLFYGIYSQPMETLEMSMGFLISVAIIFVFCVTMWGSWKILSYVFGTLISSKPVKFTKIAYRSFKEKTCIRIGYN